MSDSVEVNPTTPEIPSAESNDSGEQDGFLVPSALPAWKRTAPNSLESEVDNKQQPNSTMSESVGPVLSGSEPTDSQSSISPAQATSTASSTSISSSKMARPELKTPPPPPLSYNEPRWSTTPPQPYFLTVIKNGTVISEVPITQKPFHVFGRLPSCDVQLEHPSISRHHAILQYRPKEKEKEDSEGGEEASSRPSLSSSMSVNPTEEGFYVYDLGSTHGTFINKTKIQTRCYYRLRVGQMVKFGGSSRLFLLEVTRVGNGLAVDCMTTHTYLNCVL